MRRTILATLLLLTAACGSSPTAPTVRQLPTDPQTGSKQPPTALTSRQVRANNFAGLVSSNLTLNGCLRAADLGDVLEWRVIGIDQRAVITKGYSHGDEPGCEPTTQNLRTENDHLRYFWEGYWLVIQFDKHTYDCNRSQVDLSVDGQLLLGVVVDYAGQCAPPEPPPSEPPPPPPGPPPTPPPPPPALACMDPGAVVDVYVFNGSASFTVTQGTFQLTLVSYQTEGAGTYPQRYVSQDTDVFGPGQHWLYVEPAWPHRQEDLYCGAYPEGEDLTAENFDYWDARRPGIKNHDESVLKRRR